jgi:transcriptional regulator with XRE-family HTH domain
MSTNFSLFRDRLAEACRVRGMTQEAVCRSIGMGGRRALDFQHIGLRALDLHRVCQIADRLDVSVDWLLGRTDVMELPKDAKRKRA